jgi:hypothetical protein
MDSVAFGDWLLEDFGDSGYSKKFQFYPSVDVLATLVRSIYLS